MRTPDCLGDILRLSSSVRYNLFRRDPMRSMESAGLLIHEPLPNGPEPDLEHAIDIRHQA